MVCENWAIEDEYIFTVKSIANRWKIRKNVHDENYIYLLVFRWGHVLGALGVGFQEVLLLLRVIPGLDHLKPIGAGLGWWGTGFRIYFGF